MARAQCGNHYNPKLFIMKTPKLARGLLATFALNLFFANPATFALDYTWNGGGGDNNWSTAANWSGVALFSASTNNLILNGGARQNNTNDLSNLTNGWVRFASGGFTLNGNPWTISPGSAGIFTNLAGTNTIANNLFIIPAAKYWAVSANTELRLSGVVTNTANGGISSGWLCLTNGGRVRILNAARSTRGMDLFQGQVIVDGGLVDAVSDGIRFKPPTGSTAAVQLTNNGTMRVGGGGNFRMGHNGTVIGGIAGPGSLSQMVMSSGTLELYGPNVTVLVGDQVAGATAVFTQNGGLVWGSAGASNTVTIGVTANTDGTYNLNGGVLWIAQVKQGNAGATNVVFNWNGGTLKPTFSTPFFMQGLQTVNVQNGGAVVDTTNLAVTIGQNLQAAGTGGLTKVGTGTLTLSGANAYTGSTVVSNGTLVINPGSLTGGGGIAIADGGALTISNANSTLSVSSLSMGSAGTSTLNFDFPSGNPGSAPLLATTVTGNGNASINISGHGFSAGTFALIQFSSVAGLGNFHLGSLPPGLTGTLVTNDTTISLNISSVVKTLAWTGGLNNLWDTTSTNWADLNNGNNPTNYAQSGGFGDMVTFDDGAIGSSSVNLALAVTPVSLTVNNVSSLDYAFTGSGKISGGASLTKTGFKTLTLGTVNDFTGGVTLNGGNLYAGADQALGSGPVGFTFGTLASDGGTARSLSNAITLNANGGVIFGDTINNGNLILPGKLDFGGSTARVLNFNSDVIVTGTMTNGGFATKTGPGRLIIQGQTQQGALVSQQQGDVIIDGGRLDSLEGWRIQNFGASSPIRLAITNGGVFTMSSVTANLRVGLAGGDNATDNILDIAGTVNLTPTVAVTGNSAVTLGLSGANDYLHLRAGSLLIARAITGSAPANNEAHFYGGTIMPLADESAFISGLNNAYLENGGLTVDTTNFNLIVPQSLLAAGSGGITKLGTGSLTLSGTNTYNGPTVVNRGRVIFGAANLSPTVVTVVSNATLGFLSSSPGLTANVSASTNAAGSALEAQFSGLSSNPVAPAGFVTNLVLNGVVTVNVVGSSIKIGQFPLIGYGTIGGAGSLMVGQLPTGVVGTIVTNAGPKTIDLVVTSVTPLLWRGSVSANWDTTTTNWSVAGTPIIYSQGDNVKLDDTASNATVTMTVALTPGGVTVSNNSLAYQIGASGAGALVGSMNLVKQGSGSVAVNAANTFVGGVTVQAGTLTAGNASALGTTNGATTVQSGATLDVNGFNLGLEPIIIGGSGVGAQGALLNSGGAQNDALKDVTLTADTVMRTDGTLGIRTAADTDSGFHGNGFKLTKRGTGQINLNGGQANVGVTVWDSDLGDVDVLEGTLSFQRRMTMGRVTNTINVAANATLLLFALNNTVMSLQTKPVHLNNGTLQNNGNNATEGSAFGGPITLAAGSNFVGALTGTTLRLLGPITGTGAIYQNQGPTGTVTYGGTNTYTGETVVQMGTLSLESTAALANTPNIRVDAGATFDVSALSPWALGSNQTLGGSGSINGSVVANGTVAPGASVGALTFNSDLTLAGTNIMEVTKDGGLTNDVVTVNGTLTYGGLLKVVFTGSTPLAVNDTFRLFYFASTPSGTFTFNLPSGYTWDTTQLSVNGTVKVTAVLGGAPSFGGITQVGNNVVMTGTGGVADGTYYTVSSTNVALPLGSWTRMATNTYAPNGNFTNTLPIVPGEPQRFYRLQQ